MYARGLGGVFFKSEDPEGLRDWYAEHLGLDGRANGVVFNWRRYDRPDEVGQTIWNPLKADSDYFEPSDSSWMLSFRVDDVEAELERLAKEGVELVGDTEEYEYGKFGWIMDPEGNKVELWEPPSRPAFSGDVPEDFDAEPEGTWACPPGTAVAASGDLSDREIHKSCEVELPVEDVWHLWTTSDGMAEWWAEENDIELRVGGPMELYMLPDAPEGMRGSDDCRILSFLPNRMLSFTWNAPPQFRYTRSRHTHVVVEFDKLGDQRTRVDLHHLGWPDADWDDNDEWAETYDYFDDAWERVISLLEDYGEQ